MEVRHVVNPWYTGSHRTEIPVVTGALASKEVLAEVCQRQAFQILDEVKREYSAKSTTDFSVYTGTGGVAYVLMSLADTLKDPAFLREAEEMVRDIALHKGTVKPSRWKPSFLTGEMGLLAMAIKMRYMASGHEITASELEQISNQVKSCLADPTIPDELLFGKAGLLWSLLFLWPIAQDEIKLHIQRLSTAIIDSGTQNGGGQGAPLFFTWHDKCYLGAAHGFVGILYVLLKVREMIPEALTPPQELLVNDTLCWLLNQRFASGNLPSSLPSGHDKLVHWCHGAPGMVYLALQEYSLHPNKTGYLSAAEHCGEVIWERGLLSKGNGICHGVAGNGMALLELHRVTRSSLWLERALCFARFILDRDPDGCRLPDRPYSLFEGAAGLAFFFAEISAILRRPNHQPHFPAFSLLH